MINVICLQCAIHEIMDEEEQNLLRTLHQMQQDGNLCDLTLVSSDGEQFVAHAGILAAASFLLKRKLEECKRGHYIVVTSFNGPEISALIHYAYTGDMTDPLLSSFTDMGLLCDTLSHAKAIMLLLYLFSIKGLFCNMLWHGKQGAIQAVHSYMLAAIYPDITLPKGNLAILNVHLAASGHDILCDTQVELMISNIYCASTITPGYHLYLSADCKPDDLLKNEQHKKQNANSNQASSDICQCGECNIFFLLNKIIVRILPENNRPLHCNTCDNYFSYKQYFVKHKQNHPNREEYVCDTCSKDYIFSALKYFICHQQLRGGTKIFVCDFCDVCFRNETERKIHNRSEHPNAYVCGKCGKKLASLNDLKKHESNHIICDICGKTMKKNSDWQYHKMMHANENPFVCKICNKGFNRKAVLKTHYRIHSDDVCFICPICGKQFKTQAALHRHEMVHKDQRPYVCNLCGKRFSQRGNLKIHQVVHTGDKSHVCETCGKSYGYKAMLKKHLESHT